MIAVLITIIIAFFITNLFGYVVHWSIHQKWMGKINKSHMSHHLQMYPPENFSSEAYRHAGKDSTPRFFAIASIPMILIPILLGIFNILPWHLVIVALITECISGFLHNYLHDICHIKNHWMGDIPILNKPFNAWLQLHYIHHVYMYKNLGIFNFNWDRIFGTYKK